jgi:hypothetical protein
MKTQAYRSKRGVSTNNKMPAQAFTLAFAVGKNYTIVIF